MPAIAEYVKRILPVKLTGRVVRITGNTIAVGGFPAPLGASCRVMREQGDPIDAEVIGFHGSETLLLPYSDVMGIRLGNRVSLLQSLASVRVGDQLLGRVIDARGRYLDGHPSAVLPFRIPLFSDRNSPMQRPPIDEPLHTGVRVIDGLLTCGKGQRLGIFAGSGVGKSTLLGQMAQASSADINVVVLVGERGREVREFLERDLGPVGLAKSVVIVATSDEPAILRLKAAFRGAAIAEYFRETGKDVLLMMDSVTRFALAQREIGLAAGEPPATRGYPPSVFANLPRLLERSGRSDRGSITGFYSVLVEADDANEPISDTVRGILDGHVMLSRKLAQQAHWPAIDVLHSISRSMNSLVKPDHLRAAENLKKLLSAYRQSEDMISIGAYQAGSNAQVDRYLKLRNHILNYLHQNATERTEPNEAVEFLLKLERMNQMMSQVVTKPQTPEQQQNQPD